MSKFKVKSATLKGTRNDKKIEMDILIKLHPTNNSTWITKPEGKKFFGTKGYYDLGSNIITSYSGETLVDNVSIEIH